MAKEKQSLFQRLTKLFRSGPVVKRKIRNLDTVVAVPDKTKSSGALLFQKSMAPTYATITANAYNLSERLMRYQDFCFTGETLVATSDEMGAMRIDDIVKAWESGNTNIWTFSYDISTKSIVSSKITGAKCNGVRHVVNVVLDDGSVIRCTDDHKFMLKDSSYVEAKDLKPGTALMRFSRANFSTPYRYVQTHSRGWKPEHVLVAEASAGRHCAINEHVHHINFRHKDNRPENLIIMNEHDHMSFHAKINNMRFSDPEQRKRMSEVMKNRWTSNGDLRVNKDVNVEKTKEGRRQRRIEYNKLEKPGRHNVGRKDQAGLMNGNADKELTYQNVCDSFVAGDNIRSLSKKLGHSEYKIRKRLQWEGFRNFSDFSTQYENHKVVSVIDKSEFELVYDIEVKGYSNFALAKHDEQLGSQGIVIVHNCEMEYTPELAAALDIYADETCAQDDKGRVLHIYSDNEKIREVLEDLFYNTLNVEFNLRPWVRNLVKYGDMFLYNDVSPTHGVINAFPIPVNEIEREENYDPNDPMAVRYRWVTLGNRTLENWEVSHFRLLGNDMFLPYGSSIIEPARRIWRQLILIEDAMLVYRVVRAPERRVFYIDVANIPPENVPMYVEEQRKNLRSSQVIDRTTGRVDLRYNPLSVDEDYFIPVRGGDSGTKIDTLAGGQNTAAVEDVAYIQKKLFAALKIPRAYLGYDEALSSKATLAQEDIRFSRTINVIQKTVISELNKLAIIHLYANGYDADDLQNFKLLLSNPSTIAQQQKLEIWRSKFEIAGSAPEGQMSKEFIRKEIWGLNDEQIKEIDDQRLREKILDKVIEAAEPPKGEEGEGAGEEGGGGGGEDLFGGGGEEGGEEAGGEEAAGGEEGGGGGGAEDLFAGDDIDEKEPRSRMLVSNDDPSDDEEIPLKFSLKDLKIPPIKVRNQLQKALYNRSRIKHNGPAKIHMPDFGKMTSNNKSLSDPYDSDFFKGAASMDESYSRKFMTPVGADVMSSLKSMTNSEKFKAAAPQSSGGSKILLEERDVNEDVADEREFKNVLIIDDDE